MASDGLPRRIVKVSAEEDIGSKRNGWGSQQTRIGSVRHCRPDAVGWLFQCCDHCYCCVVSSSRWIAVLLKGKKANKAKKYLRWAVVETEFR